MLVTVVTNDQKEEGQTTQWPNEEGQTIQWQKGQTTIYKALHTKLKIEQHEPH
jgi:hypothetical protein